LLLMLVLAGSGCAGDADDAGGAYRSYVAIGDSYTAGAGSGPTVSGRGAACGQVSGSYPRLVAEQLGADLHDASCAGAQTSNGTEHQVTSSGVSWPPQLDSLSGDTDLVTVGLGFNDGAFLVGAIVGCSAVADADPGGAPCRDLNQQTQARGADLTSVADRVGDRLRDLLGEVQERAPHADVLLVGYPQLVPASGTCPQLPLAAGDYAYVRDQFDHLDDVMRQAAADAGVTFVDVHTASAGHEICAGDDAWVNGAPATDAAAAYHPFASGERAIADLVLTALPGRLG
jgi:lysophospholipase L1-like esterase